MERDETLIALGSEPVDRIQKEKKPDMNDKKKPDKEEKSGLIDR